MTKIGISIEAAKKYLYMGQPVGIPTETVYGLAANGLDKNAIAKVFETKKRPYFNPLIYHTSSWEKMHPHLHKQNNEAAEVFETLMQTFTPGPLTFLLSCKNTIPELGRAGLPRVGVRIPQHPLTQKLLYGVDFPLVAPSANIFGSVSPTSTNHVLEQLGGKIPYVLDGGDCNIGIESTVVGWEYDRIMIYRLGGITVEEIQSVYPNVAINGHSISQPSSPGQLTSHYTTRQRIIVGDIRNEIARCKEEGIKFGVLAFKDEYGDAHKSYQRVLSYGGNLNEAATNLFRYLNELQSMDIELILAEYVPRQGLGLAINDKLRRASYE